jgi:phosphoglucosamine mutase
MRGKAGEYPLDVPTVRRLGAALAHVLRENVSGPVRILSGRDTRESGPWIERELALGLASAGATLVSAGVIPTPAVAYLTPLRSFTAGVVISASHNPFGDNGIKVFSGTGEKINEALESRVEARVLDTSIETPGGHAGPVEAIECRPDYLSHLKRIWPGGLAVPAGRIAIDCANGATTTVAPRLFADLGIEVRAIGCEPDGRNINLRCGSTSPEGLAQLVVQGGYRCGVAFDGDGDRAIFVDANGRIVDGDAVMLMCAKQMKEQGRLKGDSVVATVMSNIGLEMALRDAGIATLRCAVGDKYVMEEMQRNDLSLGGEQSGHIIFSEHLFTGDGLGTALYVLRAMAESGRELADLASELQTFPQVLVNVRVRQRTDLREIPEVSSLMSDVEARLAGQGRLLVRYSGTEPLLRVMLEGRDQDEISRWANDIADAVKLHLG